MGRRFAVIFAVTAIRLLGACTEFTERGDLVRHYFGYVKVVTPAVHAPNAAVRVSDIETYGVWFAVDRRPAEEDAAGYGTGLGYQHDRREFVPLDCRVVVHVNSAEQLASFLTKLEDSQKGGAGICLIGE